MLLHLPGGHTVPGPWEEQLNGQGKLPLPCQYLQYWQKVCVRGGQAPRQLRPLSMGLTSGQRCCRNGTSKVTFDSPFANTPSVDLPVTPSARSLLYRRGKWAPERRWHQMWTHCLLGGPWGHEGLSKSALGHPQLVTALSPGLPSLCKDILSCLD